MSDPATWLDRLVVATNAHDVEVIAACFAEDYRNETPAHPARGFIGRAQVRRNWEQILGAVPDLHAEVLARSVTGDTVWSEWVHHGTRQDGSAHTMRGVVVFVVTGGLATSARFYLELVDPDPSTVDTAVRRQVYPGGAP